MALSSHLPRIVVVSDHARIRSLVGDSLTHLPVDLLYEQSAEQAAEFCIWSEPDGVIVGMSCAEDAVAAYRSLRARAELADCRVGCLGLSDSAIVALTEIRRRGDVFFSGSASSADLLGFVDPLMDRPRLQVKARGAAAGAE